MGKKIILLVLLLGFLSTPFFTRGVSARQRIPGLDCGVAGADGGIDACCYNKPEEIQGLPGQSVLDNVLVRGFIGGPIKQYAETGQNIKKLQEEQLNEMPCLNGEPDSDPAKGSCTCKIPDEDINNTKQTQRIVEMCNAYKFGTEDEPNGAELSNCIKCASEENGYWSGLGCIPLNMTTFVSQWILGIGIGLGGLIALLCIIYSAIRIQVSRGEAEGIQKARENITSCLIGLILIIFSVFILRLIGVQILGLPGLG